MLKRSSTCCAIHKEQTIDSDWFGVSEKRLAENRSNYKAIEIGAIKISFAVYLFSLSIKHSIQFDEETQLDTEKY